MTTQQAAEARAVEVLCRAAWPDGDRDGFPTRRIAEMLAAELARAGVLAVGEVETRVERRYTSEHGVTRLLPPYSQSGWTTERRTVTTITHATEWEAGQ